MGMLKVNRGHEGGVPAGAVSSEGVGHKKGGAVVVVRALCLVVMAVAQPVVRPKPGTSPPCLHSSSPPGSATLESSAHGTCGKATESFPK